MKSNCYIDLQDCGRTYKLAIQPGDHIGELVRQSGQPYERGLLRQTLRFLSPGDVVVDVGANIGNHAIYWSEVADAHVEAFEPNASALELLRGSVELNGAGARISIHPFAVGSADGRAKIRLLDPSNLGSAQAVVSDDGGVAVTSLDAALSPATSVKILKVDVEGSELEVLRGASRVLAQRPILILEEHTGQQRQRIHEILKPYGYHRLPISMAYSPTYFHLTSRREVTRLVWSSEFWICAGRALLRPLRGRLRTFLR